MWGIVPAAGRGSRIQPLAFSKELLPVGSRYQDGSERPCAVAEYLVERMVRAGADKICFVIGPGKSDIPEYFGGSYGAASLFYAVQPEPLGLCDALFRAAPLVGSDEPALVGLPDTVWFPADAFAALPDGRLSFLLFPVENPDLFDAVDCAPDGSVRAVQVKVPNPVTHWIWGGFKLPGQVLRDLERLWFARGRRDEFVGSLVNAWLARGGEASGIRAGEAYVDVGTLDGYRTALALLAGEAARDEPQRPARSGRRSPATARILSGERS